MLSHQAIFELIVTEGDYVRDLQLMVQVSNDDLRIPVTLI